MYFFLRAIKIACVPFGQIPKRNQKRFSALLQRPTRNGLKDETEKLAPKIAKFELATKLKHVSVFSSFHPTGTPSVKLTAQADAYLFTKWLCLRRRQRTRISDAGGAPNSLRTA
ncbi:hypothetical protein KL86DYS1_30800 [uncultured Dysgonomonas sp.]|uniref:Uncharacterized protein n=1 Tax=uncultured Dysgonomonas sp. TaxID=206096 RepID=A0A212JXX7_9BACT|nr:hypothetical protein KL86DYS1_30800 [uncultured Dysgonomonas sp.]